MNRTIYVDVLFLLNLTIDYIILSSCGILTGAATSRRRILLASAAGALYNVVIFFPRLSILNIVVFKIAASVLILLTAFKFVNIYRLLKLITVYYAVGAAYGGGMYAFCRFTSLGSKMNASNGVYYIDLPLWAVIVLAFAFYYITKIFSGICAGKITRRQIRKVTVVLPEGRVTLNALYDTGNTLYDPISLMPVMIAEASAFRGVLGKRLLDQADLQSPDMLAKLHAEYPHLKLRIVPFKDITDKKSCIYAFKARAIADDKNEELPPMLVGITGTKLSASGEFNALLHSRVQ